MNHRRVVSDWQPFRGMVRPRVARPRSEGGSYLRALVVPVAGSNDAVGVGCPLGVLVKQFGQGLFESTAHLELGVVVRARPLVGAAEEDDVDPEGLRPAQMAHQAGEVSRGVCTASDWDKPTHLACTVRRT
jgi:hypothetical protein